jgi:HKD family nuclease
MLISNADGAYHAGAITELIDGADAIVIAVAFLKKGGADHIAPILEKRLASGARVELFVGTDFFLTEPDALERLLKLGRRHLACDVMVADRSPATFHPKIYSARRGDRWSSVIGSANLTRGALRSIEELSIARRSGWFERDNQDGDLGSQRNDDCRAASQRQGVCAWRATIRMTT